MTSQMSAVTIEQAIGVVIAGISVTDVAKRLNVHNVNAGVHLFV